MRLQETLAPRAKAGAGRTQVRWSPIHAYQRDRPSTLLAPTLLLDGEENDRSEKLRPLKTNDSAPLDSGSHINAPVEPRERSERRAPTDC
jgi:hypothetical protein